MRVPAESIKRYIAAHPLAPRYDPRSRRNISRSEMEAVWDDVRDCLAMFAARSPDLAVPLKRDQTERIGEFLAAIAAATPDWSADYSDWYDCGVHAPAKISRYAYIAVACGVGFDLDSEYTISAFSSWCDATAQWVEITLSGRAYARHRELAREHGLSESQLAASAS